MRGQSGAVPREAPPPSFVVFPLSLVLVMITPPLLNPLPIYFTLFISQQLHYLPTRPRPVRDECPGTLLLCLLSSLSRSQGTLFWMSESTMFLSGLFADSALLAPCVFPERVPLAARRRRDTLSKATAKHCAMKTNGLLVVRVTRRHAK